MMPRLNLEGQRFGKLTALRDIERNQARPKRYCLCRCDCGKEKEVRVSHLRSGRIVSCGCHRAAVAALKALRHGHSRGPKNRSKTYRAWQSMIDRCENPGSTSYERYGGRGIAVCERWRLSFESFLQDMGECPLGLSLDRIDCNGHYQPGNCRWATSKQQARNTRRSTSVEWAGERMTIAELSERTGVSYGSLHRRIRILGWSTERAVTTPPRPNGKRKTASAPD